LSYCTSDCIAVNDYWITLEFDDCNIFFHRVFDGSTKSIMSTLELIKNGGAISSIHSMSFILTKLD
jgi:hypothetical protein